jgi:hypothetical protein
MSLFSNRLQLAALLLAAPLIARAQTGGVGIGTTAPNPAAALDVSSTTKGLLLPRLSLAQRQALGSGSIAAPVAGLVIYQTDNTPGLYAYDGAGWVRLGADNLGNHTATQALNLQGNALTGSGVSIGSAVGLGVRADGGLNIGQNTGGNNLFIGYQAGQATVPNTTAGLGTENQFSGYQSGYANTSGIQNQFGGYQSGYSNTLGSYNLFTGLQSGYGNTTGSNNVFSGYQSGSLNTTGSNNVFGGYRSGIANTTGSNNWAFGYQAGPTTGALANAGALGYNAKVSQSNSLVLGGTGSDAVQVGIGTTAPRGLLDVAGPGDSYLVADPGNGTTQSAYLPGHLFLAPYSGTSGTAYVQARVPTPTPSTRIGLTLRTTNGTSLVEAVAISPAGDVNVAGQVGMGYAMDFTDSTVLGNSRFVTTMFCPLGTRVIGGGGGHLVVNSAAQDIALNYSGPDPTDPEHGWRVIYFNNSSSDRGVRTYCTCARIQQ